MLHTAETNETDPASSAAVAQRLETAHGALGPLVIEQADEAPRKTENGPQDAAHSEVEDESAPLKP